MNYEKRFKRLVKDLLELLEIHFISWEEAEKGIFDIDDIMEQVQNDKGRPSEPVTYGKTESKQKNSLPDSPGKPLL